MMLRGCRSTAQSRPIDSSDGETQSRAAGSRAGQSHGFTLLEILLAIALIGLLSAAMVSGVAQLVDSKPKSPVEVFWEAAHAARRAALKSEIETRLSYDSKDKQFVVTDIQGVQKFPVVAERELTIDLLHAQSSGGSILIAGELMDTKTLPFVSFYADGTCMPFRVQFHTTGPANVIGIDPWTCAPVLVEAKTP